MTLDTTEIDSLIARAEITLADWGNAFSVYQSALVLFELDKVDQLERLKQYKIYNEAAACLATVSEDNLRKVIQDITHIVNSAIRRLFPMQDKYIDIETSLYQDKYPHINLKLYLEDNEIDIELQEGTGIAQVISLFYLIMLILSRGQRKFLMLDEVLHGLHEEVSPIVRDVLALFAEHGFQIIITEHKVDMSDTVRYVN